MPKKPPEDRVLSKSELREQFLHRRTVIPADLKSTTRWKVINHLRGLIADISPAVIALYYPLSGEIDLTNLARELWEDGQTVALPRVVARKSPVVFNIWPPHGSLTPDLMGIPSACGEEIHPALIVVPMLGYTRKGHRLGTGAGFYDRTLAQLPVPAITVGVCYTELELPPDYQPEPHDIPMDYIVTGKEVIIPIA